MGMKKSFVAFFICVIFIICGSGCMGKSNIELNERQKQILEEVGLPSESEELTSSQQESIIRIEEMLSYLESKYDRKFCYLGYSNGSEDSEWLTAYEEGGLKEDIITVTVAEDGSFKDNYPWLYVKEVYANTVEKYIQDELNNKSVKAFVGVDAGETTITDIDSITEESINNKCDGRSMIFILGQYNQDEIIVLAEDFSMWLKEKGISGGGQLVVVENESDYSGINEFSYGDILSQNKYTVRVNCIVNENGTVEII